MNLVEPAPSPAAHAHRNFALGQVMDLALFVVIANAIQGRHAATLAAEPAFPQEGVAPNKFVINPAAATTVQQEKSAVIRRVAFAPLLDRANAPQLEVVSLERPAEMDFAPMASNVAHRRARLASILEPLVNPKCVKFVAPRLVHGAKFAATILVKSVLPLELPAL